MARARGRAAPQGTGAKSGRGSVESRSSRRACADGSLPQGDEPLRDEPWVTTVLGEGDVVALPEIGIGLPVSVIYEDAVFAP